MSLAEMGVGLAQISTWVDKAQGTRDLEAVTWGRLAKVSEECGEVVAAYIGATGQNPRKGTTHTMEDVQKELLDVAVTALAAWEHVAGNTGYSGLELRAHVDYLVARAGLGAVQ